MTTALQPDEILTAVHLPILSPNARCGFYEVSRRAGDFAITMAYVVYELCQGVITHPRVGVGGIESKARRVCAAEALLVGRAPTPELFALAAAAASEALQMSDTNARNAAYKREVTRVAVQRALELAEQE